MSTLREHRQQPEPSPRLHGQQLLDERLPGWKKLKLNELRRALLGCPPELRAELRAAYNVFVASDEARHGKSIPPKKSARKPRKR